jgi:hypothetical protein
MDAALNKHITRLRTRSKGLPPATTTLTIVVDNHSLHISPSLRLQSRRMGISTRRLSRPRGADDDIVPETMMNISEHLSLLLKSSCPTGVLPAIVSDNPRTHSKLSSSRRRLGERVSRPLGNKSSSMPILQTSRSGGTSKRTGRWDVGASKNDNLSTENLSKCGHNARWGSSGNSSFIQNTPRNHFESVGLSDLRPSPSSRSSKKSISRSSSPEVQGSKNASWGLLSSNKKRKSGTNMKCMEDLGISSLNKARLQQHVQKCIVLPSTSSKNRFGEETSSDRWSIPTRSSDSMLVRPKQGYSPDRSSRRVLLRARPSDQRITTSLWITKASMD